MDNNQTDVKKLYNGNIAETRWRTDFDNLTRSYGYTYDALNRLTNAQYVRPSSPGNPNPADVVNTFNEKLSYDKNGNIQSLVRNGGMESQTQAPLLDNLAYQYDTTIKNKLIKVTDATANTEGFKDGADTTEEYGYDPNGNMIWDDNKNIQSIVYNHLNLPTKIVFQNGGDFPSISYLYTATGKKVAKTVNIASRNTINYTVDYLDGYQYESGKLLFFPTAEGYVKYTYGVTNPFDYVFNYTDHLGNIRLSYAVNPSTGIVKKMEENNYYPFGLKHRSYNTEAKIIVKHQPIDGFETGSLNKYMVQKTDVLAEEMERPPLSTNSNPEFYSGYNYKYNGKELQEELGLNMYDYGARNYDPALGRWMNIDPLAERRDSWSSYTYCLNNPILRFDLMGLTDFTFDKKTGEVKQIGEKNDAPDRILKTNRKGEIKYTKNGEAKVAVGGIEQGILKDGQNFKDKDKVISVGGKGQPTLDGGKSFALKLSEYIEKEIKGYSYSSDASGNVTDIVFGKYAKNTFNESYGTPRELQNKFGADFSFGNIIQEFHTHPNGELGATQTAPSLSQDVKSLKSDKFFMPNATFIILYRVLGQEKPGEYDYTKEYIPKK